MRIVLAQLNLTVGDINGNLEKHIEALVTARDKLNAAVIVFPELSLIGYPAQDLLLRKSFIEEANEALQKLTTEVKNIYCLVGYPHPTHHGLYNACALLNNGKIEGYYAKQRLPNYGVFDEQRYFIPGHTSCILPIHGVPTGIIICEDLWKLGPTQEAANHGAKLILTPNASPFESDKHEQRLAVLSKRAQQTSLPIFYTNFVGGQDEIIFDGGSMAMNGTGQLCSFAGFFNETLLPVDLDTTTYQVSATQEKSPVVPQRIERIYQALVLSLRDYVEKNHFPGVIVGVSGGIDSALTLAIAVDALGKHKVRAVFMPSRYTADISLEDSMALAHNLDIPIETISIEPVYQSFLQSLAPSFMGRKPDTTEENIQARCRAIILMALSNKYGQLVLTTGNRSELAVGYCTLYGDMAGGFAVLKNVYKTMVYQLAQYRNQQNEVIPKRTLTRPPTAELATNQKDEDTLPPYPVLDTILEGYLNLSLSIAEIVSQGFSRELVTQIVSLIHQNEYKRRQGAIGPHINHKSFINDWRYPITDGFKE